MPDTLTIAFLLASSTPNAPAGMERATAALAAGLRQLGHRVIIITAAPQPTPDPDVIRLRTLAAQFPCDDNTLRDAITAAGDDLRQEIAAIIGTVGVDVAIYVDALWGLGRVAIRHAARSVLAMHVVGHDEDLDVALTNMEHVIAPSATIVNQAERRGYDTENWSIVPNALLHEHPPPDPALREIMRTRAPIRVLGRLGPEKNIAALLEAAVLLERPADVIVADAGFESTPGAQAQQRARCAYAAAHRPLLHVRYDGLPWKQVPAWLADAAVVVVPSTRESFGLVALEAMSVGTPVVAYAVDNLPSLIGTGAEAGGVLVPRSHREHALWRAAENVLCDRLHYRDLSRAAYYRSRDFRPTTVAEMFMKAVR